MVDEDDMVDAVLAFAFLPVQVLMQLPETSWHQHSGMSQ
jgi:hypothetical protein